MKTSIASKGMPLLRAFYAFLIAGASFWAMPRSADAQLYSTQGPSGRGFVKKYDASTGVAINASFIKGLTEPVGLAVKSSK
jgi:hypothetical protein